jgi:hypothetical protein
LQANPKTKAKGKRIEKRLTSIERKTIKTTNKKNKN